MSTIPRTVNKQVPEDVCLNPEMETIERPIIPEALKEYIRIVEGNDSNTSLILGREEETARLNNVLHKFNKRNAILVGEPGVGKKSIVDDLAWRIKHGKCGKFLSKMVIVELDVNATISGMIIDVEHDTLRLISDFLHSNDNLILFINNIHNLFKAMGNGLIWSAEYANLLRTVIIKAGVPIIGTTTYEQYEKIYASDQDFARIFEEITIKMPRTKEVYPMIREQIEKLSRFHDINMSKRMVDYASKVGLCFPYDIADPARTLELVDKSMATAKLNGRSAVTTQDVLENFQADYKLYHKMTLDEKLSIAYHEAGHYMLIRYSQNSFKDVFAISIIPTEDDLGKTVIDTRSRQSIDWDYVSIVEHIAMLLGGRVAEQMFSGKLTTGAASDLEKATTQARDLLTKYGLKHEFSKRNAEEDLNDDKIQQLNDEIDQIIDEAMALAQKILKEHEQVLQKLASNLVKKGILVQETIERICKMAESGMFTKN